MKNLIKYYSYFFYYAFRLLKFEKNRIGRAYAVTFLLSILLSFNIASTVYLVKIEYDIVFNFKFIFVLIFLVISAVNLFIFNYKSRFEEYISEIENKIKGMKWLGKLLFFLFIFYLVFSLLYLTYGVVMDAIVGDFRIIFDYLEQKFFNKR